MPLPSVSLHVIKMYVASEFICLATLIYSFDFIFLFPRGTIIYTHGGGEFFQRAQVDVSSTNTVTLRVGYNLRSNLYKLASN